MPGRRIHRTVQSGLITAAGNGTTTITITYEWITRTVQVTVNIPVAAPPNVSHLELSRFPHSI